MTKELQPIIVRVHLPMDDISEEEATISRSEIQRIIGDSVVGTGAEKRVIHVFFRTSDESAIAHKFLRIKCSALGLKLGWKNAKPIYTRVASELLQWAKLRFPVAKDILVVIGTIGPKGHAVSVSNS